VQEIALPPNQPQAEVLLAIQQAKQELTTLLADATAGIQQSIATLTADHQRAILEQAKLNASFAHRDAVEQLQRRSDTHDNQITELFARMESSTADRKNIRTDLEALKTGLAGDKAHSLETRLNWLLSSGVAVAAAFAGYEASHLIH
jgi:chromosome segregation ATPase